MALPKSLCDREQEKFDCNQDDEVVVRTLPSGAVPSDWDEIDLTYNADNCIETATFKLNTTTIRVLTLTYTGGNLTKVVVT